MGYSFIKNVVNSSEINSHRCYSMRELQQNSVQKSGDSVTQQGPVMNPVRIEIEISSQGTEAPSHKNTLIPC